MDEKIKDVSGEGYIDIALDTLAQERQTLIFNNSKRSAEKAAEEVSKHISAQKNVWKDISDELLHILPSPTKQCRRLAQCARKGVVFHHSGLASRQREIIEEEFRRGNLAIISSTPTLAMGLDLPAFRAIIRDLKRFDDGGMREIPVMEYHQICGRAGRPGKESEGQAIVLCTSEKQAEHVIKKYVYGKPEDILSKLAVEPVLRMYLLSLVATEFIGNKRDMFSFFEKTFWAHQYEDMAEIAHILEHLVDLLSEWKFIETDKYTGKENKGKEIRKKKENTGREKNKNNHPQSGFISASLALQENHNYHLRATRLGKRIAELYLDPLSGHELIKHLVHAENTRQGWFAYLYAIVSTSEMRPYLSIVKNDYEQLEVRADLRKNEIPETVPEVWDEEYEEFLQKFKTCLLLESWMDERSEEWLLEQYNARPGDLQYKLQNAEWIIHCSQELSRMLELRESMRVLNELNLRMKYGAKKELLSLLRLKGIGRVRARILYASNICDLGDVKRAEATALARLLGPEIAKSIKKQVGVVVTGTSEWEKRRDENKDTKEKRMGQQLLDDY